MATIEPRRNSAGEITSYRIRVSVGCDMTGKQIRRSTTWKPEPGMSQRKIEKALTQAAADFERDVEQGYQTDNRLRFAEYAARVIDQKEANDELKHSTALLDRYFLIRTNTAIGHIRLTDLRPQHLNDFYRQLQEGGIRIDTGKAVTKVDLGKLLQRRKMTRTALSEAAGVSHTTVTTACRGQRIQSSKARKIAAALEMEDTALFKFLTDASPLSSKTIIGYHRFIHAVLAQAEKEMLVPYNAASKASPPKVTQKEPNYFQPDELNRILDALEEEPLKWRTITHLMIITGCRRGEIMGLKWSKVNLDAGRLKIDNNLLYSKERGIYDGSPKTGQVRFVTIPKETVSLLKQYRAEQSQLKLLNGDRWNDTGYVFTRDDGRPMFPSSPTAWLDGFAKRHGLPHINPHAFRHTMTSLLINQGTDVVTVSKRLGHSRTSTTTDLYSHVIQEADAQASEQIADVMLRHRKKA